MSTGLKVVLWCVGISFAMFVGCAGLIVVGAMASGSKATAAKEQAVASASGVPPVSAAPEPERQPDRATESVRVSIRELLSEYKDNEVRADISFKGKVVESTGVVDDVGKDILSDAYVTLGTGSAFEIPQVQCYPIESHMRRVATLRKGHEVTFRGKVDGLMMNVLVRECELTGPSDLSAE